MWLWGGVGGGRGGGGGGGGGGGQSLDGGQNQLYKQFGTQLIERWSLGAGGL